MNQRLLDSTAYPITFPLGATNGKPAIGLSPTVLLSKNGAPFAAAAGAVTEIGNGAYALAGNATDRNTLGDLLLYVTAPGCYPYGPALYEITSIDPFAPLPEPPAPPPSTPVINVTQTNTDDDDSEVLAAIGTSNEYLKIIANSVLPLPERFP